MAVARKRVARLRRAARCLPAPLPEYDAAGADPRAANETGRPGLDAPRGGTYGGKTTGTSTTHTTSTIAVNGSPTFTKSPKL